MALTQVGARTEGDVYQGLFFWKQAADLFRPNSKVDRVDIEHDEADGVDDVAVFYRDHGNDAGGWLVTADFYQLKYHVDNRNCYSSDALVSPAFINAQSSLLQRFHHAYTNLLSKHHEFRLHLASNWRWKDDDKLAKLLREYDGALPSRFFSDGARSDFRKIREQWREHLDLEQDEFRDFAKRLRFQLDHFGRRDFKAYVYTTLEAAGLWVPSADRASCPYQSLVQQFLMNGPNSFYAETLREYCDREGLFLKTGSNKSHPISVGVRSFVRFAERLEAEVDEFVCVSEQFEGRHPSSDTAWEESASKVLRFLRDADRRSRLRAEKSVISLECHGSLALLAGWELSRNSGARTAPTQKPSLDVWRPNDRPIGCVSAWNEKTISKIDGVEDVAICLSVTHDICNDVEDYLSLANSPRVGHVLVLSPEGGPSPHSIRNADHAYQLAAQIPSLLAKLRSKRTAQVHLFFACPNALMFFIGQQREGLGRVAMYEFDFGLERDGLYSYSFSIPIVLSSPNESREVPDDPSV